MANTWVLVANASEAQLYATDQVGAEMSHLRSFGHPESREKGSVLASDRPGKVQSGRGGRGIGDPSAPKDYEAERFARELAQALDDGRAANAYQHLVLVAAPHFHGLLNSQLDEKTRAMVGTDINKDFTSCNERDLQARLKESA
jgi:protein required for attachment to host cells